VNWARANGRPSAWAKLRAGGQRLTEAGIVLDEHVAAGEDAGEHLRQRGACADDGASHLVEHLGGLGVGGGQSVGTHLWDNSSM